jgi:trimethylamine--corrinoid protein Co-methyltransferase
MIEGGMTWSHEQLVIDDDIIRMVKRVIQGIDVTDETMAVDMINQIHEKKNYLREQHTLRHMRTQSKPRLFDRTTRTTWRVNGARDTNQQAKEEARKILKTHQPEPLSEDVKRTLREIVASAEKEAVMV